MGEAFELAFPGLGKLMAFADAQIGDDARDEDLAGLGLATETGGELDARAEQIVGVLDRLAGGDTDTDDYWAERLGRICSPRPA